MALAVQAMGWLVACGDSLGGGCSKCLPHTLRAVVRSAALSGLSARVQASSQGVRQNKLDNVTIAFVGVLISL